MKPGQAPDEAELQALYRAATAGEPDGPAPAVEARILAAARAATAHTISPDSSSDTAHRTNRRPARGGWWTHWLVPVSVSAVAVLGVSLTLRVNDQQAALESARQADEAPTAGSAEPLRKKADPLTSGGAIEKKESGRLAPSPIPVPRDQSTTRPALGDSRAEPGGSEHAALAPHHRPEPPAALENNLPAERRTRSTERDEAAGMATPAAPAALAAPAAPPSLRRPLATAAAPPFEASPERWLEEIRRLRDAGQNEEAQRQLDRLRARHPGFPLPNDLK